MSSLGIVPHENGGSPPEWVTQLTNNANQAILDARLQIKDINAAGVEFDSTIDSLISKLSNETVPAMPSLTAYSPGALGNVDINLPDFSALTPARPTLLEAPATTGEVAPVAPGAAPTIQLAAIPAIIRPSEVAVPVITDVTVPDAPTLALDAPPVVGDLTLPTAPVITLPLLAFTKPDAPAELTLDNMTMNYEPFSYASRWYTALEAKFNALRDELATGLDSTGLKAEAEAAIFGRAKDRANAEMKAAVEAVTNQYLSRGFHLPAGPLLAAAEQARVKGLDAVSEVNRELSVKRAEWSIDTWKFVMEKMAQLDEADRQYQLATERLRMDAAVAALQGKVNAYNTIVSAYQARLEGFRAELEYNKAQIELELGKLQVYQGQLEGVKVQGDVYRTRIDAYNAYKDSVLARVDLYKAQISAVEALQRSNEIKIGIFKSQVEANASYMNAQVAEAQAVASYNESAMAPLKVHQATVQAYGEEVKAYATKLEAKTINAKLVAQNNETLIEAYKADIQATAAQASAYSSKVGAQAEVAKTKIEAFRANAEVASRISADYTDKIRATMDYSLRSAEVIAKATEGAAQVVIEKAKIEQSKSQAIGQLYANMAASAFSAVHAQWSNSSSFEKSENLSESHQVSYQAKSM